MIKAAIFDLGGVYFTNGTKLAIKKISTKYKLEVEEVENMLKPGSKFGKLFRQGKITANEFFDKLRDYFKIRASNKELFDIWFNSYAPIKGTISIVKRLGRKGVKVYFLSDNVKERADYLQKRYKFTHNFISGIFSHAVGITKFDGTKIFKMALKQTGDKAENIVFIDDNENHTKTAKGLGMHVILFKNPKQLNKELNKMLRK